MFPAIPAAAEPLVDAIGDAFTRPTLRRFVLLMCGLIVTMGRRTVSHALVPIAPLLRGHWSDYHRLYSAARFSMWELAAALVRQVIRSLPQDVVIELVADDTVVGKDGDHVWAKGVHRDSTHSSRSVDQVKFGHRWLVLCVLVRLEGLTRPWALPILCGLCISPKVARQIGAGARQKTPSDLARQLLIVLMRQLPGRRFVLLGDYQVITHKTACFAARHSDRVTVVGRLRGDANLYAPPDPKQRRRRVRGGGYCSKGGKIPSPVDRVQWLRPVRRQVAWYGGTQRAVRCVSESGALWFSKQNCAVVPIRWVCVLGKNKPNDYFYSSDPTLPPRRIIELYALRWNIEVTFQETRQRLGLETTRHWCRRSVLRVTPLIFGLFSAVTLMWQRLPGRLHVGRDSCTPCYHKQAPTFADALHAVRQELWEQALLRHHDQERCLNRLPLPVRRTILWHLAAAA